MLDALRNELARDLQSMDDYHLLTSNDAESRAGYILDNGGREFNSIDKRCGDSFN